MRGLVALHEGHTVFLEQPQMGDIRLERHAGTPGLGRGFRAEHLGGGIVLAQQAQRGLGHPAVHQLLKRAVENLPPLRRVDLVELDRDPPRLSDLVPGCLQWLSGPLECPVDLLVAGPVVTMNGTHTVVCDLIPSFPLSLDG